MVYFIIRRFARGGNRETVKGEHGRTAVLVAVSPPLDSEILFVLKVGTVDVTGGSWWQGKQGGQNTGWERIKR